MTVTNTAATVARHTEIDTKASALDFRLHSIVLLKRQGKSSLKNTVSPSSFRGWLESSPSEDERWLRNRAQDSDLYAMQKPGLRLVIGDGCLNHSKRGSRGSRSQPNWAIPSPWKSLQTKMKHLDLRTQHRVWTRRDSHPVCGTLGSWSLYSRTKGRLGHVVSCY